MKVLVTGGTGFVGSEIVRALSSAGHEVHLLVRKTRSGNPSAEDVRLKSRSHFHLGDVLDPGSLRSACDGMDAVIHLVGIIGEVGRQTFENIHTRATQNVVAAAQQTGVRRFVQMSALGTRAEAVSRYHQSKWAAEEIVRKSGLDWTIFRPSIIYGPGDGFVNLYAAIISRSPIVPIMGRGEVKFQPVPIKAVGQAFVKSLTEPRASQRTFDLCGSETLTLNEIVKRILHVKRRRRLLVHFPFALANIQAAALEIFFQGILRKASPLNRDQLIMLKDDNVGDGGPANKLFGLKPEKFSDGIALYLARAR